jgi:hypothetical protein
VSRQQVTLAIVVTWLLFSAAVVLGLKSFNIWEQVVEIHARNWTLTALYDVRHAHFLRYAVAYPIFVVADGLGVSVDFMFNLVCTTLLLVLVLVLRATERAAGAGPGIETRVVAYAVILFGAAYFMNGRVLFGLLGFSLLILAFARYFAVGRWSWWAFPVLAVGTLLCSVSSGIFAVAFMFQGLCLAFGLAGVGVASWRNRLGMAVSVAVVFMIFQEFLLVGVVKNLEFYGGGMWAIWEMLNHGAGRYITVIDPMLLLLAVPLAVMVAYIGVYLVSRSTAINTVTLIALASAVAGGVYGFSTLSIGLIPLLLIRPWSVVEILGSVGEVEPASP